MLLAIGAVPVVEFELVILLAGTKSDAIGWTPVGAVFIVDVVGVVVGAVFVVVLVTGAVVVGLLAIGSMKTTPVGWVIAVLLVVVVE